MVAAMPQVDVTTPGSTYPVFIGTGLLERIDTQLDQVPAARQRRRLVVSSPGIWRLHGASLPRALRAEPAILVPDGERQKTLPTVARIYDGLARAGADRATVLVAFGGGVIGDMAGFAAATWQRGISCVQVPTTLLAQVDSAIGGKTGVNHPLAKNMIGAFHQPAAVVSDTNVLSTLPRREFRSGLYEVVKYGVIASNDLFTRLLTTLPAIFARTPDAIEPIVTESSRIKASVVAADEREAGPRRVLNFGHTAGHALEAVTKYRRFRHGEAIAYGMLVAAEIAVRRKALDPADRAALATLIAHMGPLPTIADLSASETSDVIRRDKKVVAGKLHFVLPTGIGRVEIVDDVSQRELVRALKSVGLSG